jgi:spermidine/putrescine transport system ATP-binding protein
VKGSAVTIQSVSKHFGDFHALKDVDLSIHKGEFFSLLGPSGCGKTTLLRIIAGFESPSAGIVSIGSQDVVPIPPEKRPVNTVFQNYALFPHLTIFENIAFPLRLKKTPQKEVVEKVSYYLKLVQLHGQENKKPNQLSGGQKQRVAIARALINEPEVLLLDEPLSALDAKLRQQLLIDLDTIHDRIGITFIYVTHDQSEALSVSDRVAVMNNGNVLQVGTPFEIYETPADSFVAKFIGETNLLTGTITQKEDLLYTIDTPPLGPIMVTSSRDFPVGSKVIHSIRPEKIAITKQKPEGLPEDFNLLRGKVFESIYSGFQSKFFVDVMGDNKIDQFEDQVDESGLPLFPKPEEKFQFRVFKQHENFMEFGPNIKWKDLVYLNWDSDDGYIVEMVDQ